MPTTKVWCWCGAVLDEKGECPLHTAEALARVEGMEGYAAQEMERAESEDVRIALKHNEQIRSWRRAAILATIAACVGWILAIAGWLRW